MMLCADRSASYGKAEPLEKESLEIYQKVLGKEHPNTATAMARLAFFYEEIWDFSKAELLLRDQRKRSVARTEAAAKQTGHRSGQSEL